MWDIFFQLCPLWPIPKLNCCLPCCKKIPWVHTNWKPFSGCWQTCTYLWPPKLLVPPMHLLFGCLFIAFVSSIILDFYFINISFEGTYGMLKKKLQCNSNFGTWKKVNYDNNSGAEGVLFEAYAYSSQSKHWCIKPSFSILTKGIQVFCWQNDDGSQISWIWSYCWMNCKTKKAQNSSSTCH